MDNAMFPSQDKQAKYSVIPLEAMDNNQMHYISYIRILRLHYPARCNK